MKTLTITEAKKNLGKWLKAAVNGDEVAIINGATCVALRPVQIEAADYAWREYGAHRGELEKFQDRVSAEIERLRRDGRLIAVPENKKEAFEKIAGLKPGRSKAGADAAGKRKSRRRPRVA
jgi:antitoxin (DNA-binding transcriptional repressor) of toxin-antitoxin stability system